MSSTTSLRDRKTFSLFYLIIDTDPCYEQYEETLLHIVDGTTSWEEWYELPRQLVYSLPFKFFLRIPEGLWDHFLTGDLKLIFEDHRAGNEICMYPDSDSDSYSDNDNDTETEEDYDEENGGTEYETTYSFDALPHNTPPDPQLHYNKGQTSCGSAEDLPRMTGSSPDRSFSGHDHFESDRNSVEDLPDYDDPFPDQYKVSQPSIDPFRPQDLADSSRDLPGQLHSLEKEEAIEFSGLPLCEFSSEDSRVSETSSEDNYVHHPKCGCPWDHFCSCIRNWHTGDGTFFMLYRLDSPTRGDASHVQMFKAIQKVRGDCFGNHESSLRYQCM